MRKSDWMLVGGFVGTVAFYGAVYREISADHVSGDSKPIVVLPYSYAQRSRTAPKEHLPFGDAGEMVVTPHNSRNSEIRGALDGPNKPTWRLIEPRNCKSVYSLSCRFHL